MPSFDVVSEVDMHEVTNALDQTNKELTTRFDLKDSGSKVSRSDNVITVESDGSFHLEQVVQILRGKLAKRGVDLLCLKEGEVSEANMRAKQTLTLQQGIEAPLGKQISKLIKDAKLKTQASLQDQKVRVTGKKRDDLQATIQLLKQQEFPQPLQFNNFRD